MMQHTKKEPPNLISQVTKETHSTCKSHYHGCETVIAPNSLVKSSIVKKEHAVNCDVAASKEHGEITWRTGKGVSSSFY